MKCQKCKKNNANVKITEIINDNKIEMFLCDECAKKVNVPNMKFDIDDFFSGFFNSWPTLLENELETERKCSKCGFTFDDFMKYGQFGCPHCYETFSDNLDAIFERIHGKTRHVGKGAINKLTEAKKKIENTSAKIIEREEKLRKAILEERYEDAAKYRDEIKILKEKLINKKTKEV